MQQKVKFFAQERLIIPDINNMQDFVEEEFYLYNSKFLTATTKIVGGFVPSIGTGTNISVSLTDAKLFNTSGTYKAFYVAETGASDLTATLADNTTSYVHIQVNKMTGSSASRAFWVKTANDGAGGEIEQEVETTEYLEVSLFVSTSGFSSDINKIPVAEITTIGGSILPANMHDRRNLFFRLGTGTNPAYNKTLVSLTEDDTNFASGDRELSTQKEWMDFVMTKFKQIQGTSQWYENPPGTLGNMLYEAVGGGFWNWNQSNPADISSYTVVQNATILLPVVEPFTANGTIGGTFEIATDPATLGISIGTRITIIDDDSAALKCVVVNIAGGGPYTITVELGHLEFDEPIYIPILGTGYTNTIQVTESPICMNTNSVAYVDLNYGASVNLNIVVVDSSSYSTSSNRLVIARRYGNSIWLNLDRVIGDEIVDGDKHFTSITLPAVVTVDQVTADYSLIFANPGGARDITFGDPGANADITYDISPYLVPIGSIIPFYDYDGLLTFDTNYWAYCNGQTKTIGSIGSKALPDLSNRYLVGFGVEGGGTIPLNISMYTIGDNATIVSPAIPFLSSGTINGTFTVNSISGLSMGKTITISDSSSPPLVCNIKDISGSSSPYTVTVDSAVWTTSIVGSASHEINIAHTHTGPSHTHTGPSHTHTGPSHNHSVLDHVHTGPNHQHAAGSLQFTTGRYLGGGSKTWYGVQSTGGDLFMMQAQTVQSGAGATVWGQVGLIASQSTYTTNGVGSTALSGTGFTGLGGAGNTGFAGTGATGVDGTGNTGSAGTGATSSSLSPTQSIQPRSIRVRYIMRIK